MRRYTFTRLAGILPPLLMVGTLPAAAASDTAWADDLGPIMLAQETGEEQPAEPIATRTQIETTEEVEVNGCPFSLSLTYALYSDYVFRGINFSEPAKEGGELPNHQVTVDLAVNLDKLGLDNAGTLGFITWFEWYGGQKKIDPLHGGQNLQEVDYTIYWSHAIDPIATDLTVGYTFYEFINLAKRLRQDGARGNNNDDRSQEYYFSLEHNDAWMWKSLFPDNEDGILNPSFLFAHDIGSLPGVWMETGISHGFAIPGIDNFTITPGYKLMFQCGYWKDGFFLAGDQWSLNLAYDLTPILHLPDWAGTVTLGGDLWFFNAMGDFEGPDTNGQIRGQDEFYGGMTVNWSWGG